MVGRALDVTRAIIGTAGETGEKSTARLARVNGDPKVAAAGFAVENPPADAATGATPSVAGQ